jgi:hypothetical protein
MSEQKLIGHVETDSGSLFIVDGVWRDSIPAVFQKNVYLEEALIDDKRNILPVYLLTNQGKRFLLIGLDDGVEPEERATQVETENPVDLPEPPAPLVPPTEADEDDDIEEEEDENE